MEIRIFASLPQPAVEIRKAVFVEEQGFESAFDDYENSSTHFLAYVEGTAAGTGRVHFAPEYKSYKIGRIAVLKEYRGRGIGEAVVSAAEEWLAAQGESKAVILAQQQAVGFYEKIGYSKTDFSVTEENRLHILMAKSL